MVKISGKYKLAENRNLYELLLAVGQPEDKAIEGNKIIGMLEVKLDGRNIFMQSDTPPITSNLVLDDESEESYEKMVFKSLATLSGNVLTITSKVTTGELSATRTYTFLDNELEVVISASKDGKTLSATRIYKRV